MTPRQLLSPQARAALFDPPREVHAIVRHYTFSREDLTLIRQRRREANRLGFAVHLAYLRFPGRVLGPRETPPAPLLAFLADQLRLEPKAFGAYAQRGETRREHLAELQAYLGVRPFGREDARAMARIALGEAMGTDRGEAIVGAMVVYLRQQAILLPSAAVLERIGLAERARARQQAYKALTAGLDHALRHKLHALIQVAEGQTRTPLAWLREWPQAPRQKNLAGIVERLAFVRALGLGPDREGRIHRARYAILARETAVLSAQHLYRFDAPRRLATLVVFAREMEAELTDAALGLFDKMLGRVFRKADRQHQEHLLDRAKLLDQGARALVGVAKALLSARASGTDPLAAVEQAIGWQRLETLVASLEGLEASRADNLAEVIERYAWVHRAATVILGAFTFCSWKPTDPVLRALKALRQFYASGQRKLPAGVPTAFLAPAWRKLVGRGAALDPRGWEVAVIVTLRDRLRAGDLWVEGSRAFRAFDDFLLPPAAFAAKRQAGELGLAVPDRFEAWRDERLQTLERRLREVAALAAAGQLPEAVITEAGLSISPIRQQGTEAEDLARRLYGMLPRLRITELLAEVQGWTGFVERFVHLRTGAPPEDPVAVMTTVLADATNLGLARMAHSSGRFSPSRLLWTAEWHLRDETYQAALACLVDAIHAQPFSALWGEGDTSSSDGQFFRAGGPGSGPRRAQRPLRLRARPQILHPPLRPLWALLHPGDRGQRERGPPTCWTG